MIYEVFFEVKNRRYMDVIRGLGLGLGLGIYFLWSRLEKGTGNALCQ